MSITELIQQKKRIQESLLEFLEDESNVEENYENFVQIINDQKILEDKYEFKFLIQMINKISDNHQRIFNFIEKIERVLIFLKSDLNKYFTNSEKFELFKGNKRILLFLLEEKIVTIDETIFLRLTSNENIRRRYIEYFGPEIKEILTNEFIATFFKKHEEPGKEEILKRIPKEFGEEFYTKRKIGENDNILCELIRQKKTKDFIVYVNLHNIPLNSYVEESIFETNSFLIFNENSNSKAIKKVTLIEYAAFFESNEIIKYMRMNEVKLTASMWYYAVHSKNAELIKDLEDSHDLPPDLNYEQFLYESIKCHHNDVAKYIIYNLIDEEDLKNNIENRCYINIYEYCFRYFNFCFFQKILKTRYLFYLICENGLYTLVKLYLEQEHIDINATNI
ncbi:hypothetical protein M9Y10_010604 [Tritrichomonas musculus]|uniref:DUF3447 domain-containing protein n=1 Tax=Tritrichomonas musculus TaxID=1915356 RepID=A0ABR2IMF1_9EUKA